MNDFKKFRSFEINRREENSNIDFIGKEQSTDKVSKKDKKNNKKGLERLNELEVKKETKFSLGKIKYAKLHKQATKPLKQLQDLTEEEIRKYSCPCCGLPSQISGKLESYKICDNPDKFSNCGMGVVLYYSFIKFIIFITFIATIGISCFNIYCGYYYNYELRKIVKIIILKPLIFLNMKKIIKISKNRIFHQIILFYLMN